MTAQDLRNLIEGDALTEREVEVLYGIALGETHTQTGERLFLSPETIKDYRKKVVAKLGAKNLPNAIVKAIGIGVIDISKVLDEEF